LIEDKGTFKPAKQRSIAHTLKMIEDNKKRDAVNAKKKADLLDKQFTIAQKDQETRAAEIAEAKAEAAAQDQAKAATVV
jgi:hypothetical protein